MEEEKYSIKANDGNLPPLEYQITEEILQALFQGQRVVYSEFGKPEITLYPPRYGVFMTHEKMNEIRKKMFLQFSTSSSDELMKMFDDLFETNLSKFSK